jgi:hypothetical protein
MKDKSDGEILITLDDLLEGLEPVRDCVIEDEELMAGLWDDLIVGGKNKKEAPNEEEWESAVNKWIKGNGKDITKNEAKRQFARYFHERFEIDPFVRCPRCGIGITWPRENAYGQYFIGCGGYPDCKYISTRDDRDRMIRELDKLKDEILNKAEERMADVNRLLSLARKIKDHSITYDKIRNIKKEWLRYE